MLEAELTAPLGYEKYEAKGRNSGKRRNGKTSRKLRTSNRDLDIEVPRDRNGDFQSQVLAKHQASSNQLEAKILGLYAKELSTRDIQGTLEDLYGVDLSAASLRAITDQVWSLVEAWQNRPLAAISPMVYRDALHLKLRREGKIINTACSVVLGVDLEGQRDGLGHWLGDGGEGANFWLNRVSDLQARGVEAIFIACIDGLTGFKDALQAVFPQAQIQRCVIHPIRQSLKYVGWKDRKALVGDLKPIYRAPTREAGEAALLNLGERWGKQYAVALRSWETNWNDLATRFAYPAAIRRLIDTTNTVEGYHRPLRQGIKTKASFPTDEAARKLLYQVTQHILRQWTGPIFNWPLILNQLAIRFEDRLSF
jgi:transposase-like protein